MSGHAVGDIVTMTRAVYNRYAGEYAATTGRLDQFPGLEGELDRFLNALPDGPVLDLGCGAGRDSEHLARHGAVVVAGDLSEQLLLMARSRCAPLGAVQLDLMSLPFRAGGFAGVWACGSVVHVPREHHLHAFREISRVLGPGGIASISLKEGDHEGWMSGERLPAPRWFSLRTPESVTAELRGSGFAAVRVVPSGRGSWFVVEAVRPADSTRPDRCPAGRA